MSKKNAALNKLGVSADIVSKEKGLKKLGICDHHIVQAKELAQYDGFVEPKSQLTKSEMITGYTIEKIRREKAVKKLGVSEEQIEEEHSKKISALGFPSFA